MRIREVAQRLGITRQTALRNVRSGVIPGGELAYKLEDGRERWYVDRGVFDAWRAQLAASTN